MTGTRVLLTVSQGRQKPTRRGIYFWFSCAFLLLVCLSACVPVERAEPQSAWEYSDLRLLEPEDTSQEDLDLIALYSRLAGSDFQVRLDLLDLQPNTQADIYLALDTIPGGSRALPFQAQAEIDWDLLLAIKQTGNPQTFSPPDAPLEDFQFHPDLIPRISRLPWLDSLVISINSLAVDSLEKDIAVEAFILPAGGTIPADRLKPVRTDSLPPGRANLLLAFWNSFPAFTPAQALRRWDGAHTGPFGEHHGLHVLLQNVRRYDVPVALLDLKNPIWLSALDLVGGIPNIQHLAGQGLVILPDVLPGSPTFSYFPGGLPDWATGQAIHDSRKSAADFALPASQLLYAPYLSEAIPPGYSLIFSSISPGSPTRWRESRLLPIPSNGPSQIATAEGLTPEIRRILLKNALAASANLQQYRLLILGGSLPDSAFGDPQSSLASLLYISGHPWMRALRSEELSALPPNLVIDLPPDEPDHVQAVPDQPFSTVLASLREPGNDQSLDKLVWQAALALFAPLPPESPELISLRAIYSGQLGYLKFAAEWAKSPQPIHECNADIDQDGLPECLYATNESLAIIDRLGGRLLALFYISNDQPHQLIGPTTQFLAGQADPSTWNLLDAEAADPGSVQGAFIDRPPPWELYQAVFFPNSLTLSTPEGDLVKQFTFIQGGLRVNFQITAPLTTRIPLVFDPWQRFSPGWGDRYKAGQLPDGWIWQIEGGPQIKVRTTAQSSLSPFNASLLELQTFEDPNYAYPAGHYLVFPLALVDLKSDDDFRVEITYSEH